MGEWGKKRKKVMNLKLNNEELRKFYFPPPLLISFRRHCSILRFQLVRMKTWV